jgi:predicted nucleic acid-binding protein
MMVVDASAVIEVLLNSANGQRIAGIILNPAETLHAPHLLDLEVAQVLRRYSASGAMRPSRAREALSDYLDMPISRYAHDLMLGRVWELRRNFTAYDALYIALAESLPGSLVTCDAALATNGHRAHVVLV